MTWQTYAVELNLPVKRPRGDQYSDTRYNKIDDRMVNFAFTFEDLSKC